jgi:hypothetical protein
MNEKEIAQFLSAFEDFMKHSEVEIDAHFKWKEASEYTKNFFEQKKLNKNYDLL